MLRKEARLTCGKSAFTSVFSPSVCVCGSVCMCGYVCGICIYVYVVWYIHVGQVGGVCVCLCVVLYMHVCVVCVQHLWVVCGVEVCVVHARVCMHVHMHIWKAEEGKEHLQLLVSTLFS